MVHLQLRQEGLQSRGAEHSSVRDWAYRPGQHGMLAVRELYRLLMRSFAVCQLLPCGQSLSISYKTLAVDVRGGVR